MKKILAESVECLGKFPKKKVEKDENIHKHPPINQLPKCPVKLI